MLNKPVCGQTQTSGLKRSNVCLVPVVNLFQKDLNCGLAFGLWLSCGDGDHSEVWLRCFSAQAVNVDRQELTPDQEADDPGLLIH